VKWDFLQFRHHWHLRQSQFRKASLCLGSHLSVCPKLRTVKHKQLVDVRESVHRDGNYESNQQDATIQVSLLFLVSSTCFGRCFRPSSGALDCIYGIW
jgi:hypothetical protein